MRQMSLISTSFLAETLPSFVANAYSASFALKKYVKEFWSPFYPSFKGPVATPVEVRLGIPARFDKVLNLLALVVDQRTYTTINVPRIVRSHQEDTVGCCE